MKKILLLSLFLMLLAGLDGALLAQDRTVSGKVTAADDGAAIPGVNVVVKGTTAGATTDSGGRYTISVPGNATLVFSFIGLATQEIAVGSRSTVDVQMASDVKGLTEVVVVGYGQQEKRNVTGSVSTIKGDALTNLPVQSFDQALQGRATGVNVSTPNGVLGNPPVIRIRGTNSITSGSAPLVVIDGMPMSSGNLSGAGFSVNNALGGINPADIESIEILKDASAAAIYGSRAGNGVILITTKKGKTGKAQVNFGSWFGFTQAFRKFDVLDAQEYIDIKNEAIANQGSLQPQYFPTYRSDGGLVDTNWYDELFRNGNSQNYDLSVSGANDKTNYLFSLGYTDQAGFLKRNDFSRISARMNLSHKITDWLSTGTNLQISNTTTTAPNTGSLAAFNSGGLGRLAIALPPNVAPKLEDGSYNIEAGNRIGRMNNLQPSTWWNPIVDLEQNRSSSEVNRVLGNFFAELRPLPGLSLRSSYGIDFYFVEVRDFRNSLHGEGAATAGSATNVTSRNLVWNWQNTANYTKTFADAHTVSLLAGYEAQNNTFDQWGATRQNIADPFFTTYQGNWTTINPVANFQTENGLVSYLSRLSYDYKGKYLFSGNIRRDGFSALSRNNKWGTFIGASVGWRISDEAFFKDAGFLTFISDFKLRASRGRVGNVNLPNNFGSLNFFSSGLYGTTPTWAFSQVGNADLKWESSTKTDVGFDLSFFNDRIATSFTYYVSDIDNLILNNPQSPSKGIPGGSILTNIGRMENKGIEFSVTSTNIRKANFTWTSTFNITTNYNKVLALNQTNDDIFQNTGGLEQVSIARVGYPIGSLFAVRTAGVNPDNGRRIFINQNGESVQYDHAGTAATRWTYLDGSRAPAVGAADRVIVGNTNPKWFGGLDNTVTYGNFDLNVFLQYSGGNYIYNGTRAGLLDQRNWNNDKEILNRWTEAGQQTDIPRVVWTDNVSNGSAFPIDDNVEKGDFLRVRNIQLGYTFKQSILQKAGISSVRLYGQVQNAAILTNYRGADPENTINGDVNIAAGVDRNSLPQARNYNMGLNIVF